MSYNQMRLHKNVFQSKTILALLVAIVITIAKDQGYHIDFSVLDAELQSAVKNFIQLAAFVVIAYGRVTASKKISV